MGAAHRRVGFVAPTSRRRWWWSSRAGPSPTRRGRYNHHIALAHLDGPIDRDPRVHVFYDTHVEWVTVGDDLKKLGGPSGTEAIESPV